METDVKQLTNSATEEIICFLKEHYTKEITLKNDFEICLPQQNLYIEFYICSQYNEIVTSKQYHYRKAKFAEKNGIKLIQIFEYEWTNKKNIVKSRLLSLLGINKKIYARKTSIVNLSKAEKSLFLNRTHIQGNDNSSIKIGLKYEDKIVSCMTFGKPRYNKGCNYELIRYSSELNTNVVGGASKLLTYFKENYSGSIVSYADLRWSFGGLYRILGFTFDGFVDPGYVYYDPRNKSIHSRVAFQKHKLKDMPFYESHLSESQIMKLNDYKKIWNAGQLRFILKDNNENG